MDWAFLQFLDPMNMLVISVSVILVSVVASLQPVLKASRMEPKKALRQV
jgi:ABC-type lipoprotein release transport system permease subunit